MSLERAIEDQLLMDQIYASLMNTLRHHHHRQRRRRRHDRARARRHRREDPDRRARRLHPAGRSQLESGLGLEGSALPHDRDVARRSRPAVPSVHALLRRRQHQVLGHGDVSAAPGGFQGDAARRRRVAGVADRLRHAGAVLRSRRSDVRSARRGGRRSDRGAAQAVSVSAGPPLQGRRRASSIS